MFHWVIIRNCCSFAVHCQANDYEIDMTSAPVPAGTAGDNSMHTTIPRQCPSTSKACRTGLGYA